MHARKRNEAFHEPSSADRAQPFQGCGSSTPHTQGSSFLATLGFVAESLWDSRFGVHGSNGHSSNFAALHELSNEHAAPTELGNDQGALAAIDMALLRSFSARFMVPMHARRRNEALHESWVGGRGGLCRERWVGGGRSLPPHPSPLP